MTELSARLGLYAAIDRAAEESDDRLRAVADVIPLYRRDVKDPARRRQNRGTQGWHKRFNDLLPAASKIPALPEALEELAEPQREEPLDPLEQAQRLRAVWTVLKVLPDEDWDSDQLAKVLRPVVDPDAGDATSLVQLMSVSRHDDARDWPALLQQAHDDHHISDLIFHLAKVGCHDWETYVPVRGDGTITTKAAARVVSFVNGEELNGRTLDTVEEQLRPVHWPACLASFWCDMDPVLTPPQGTPGAAGPAFYQEFVGDCGKSHDDAHVWFHPYLVVVTRWFDDQHHENGFEIQYDLAARAELRRLKASMPSHGPQGRPRTFEQDDRVEVDSGKIIVKPTPGQPTQIDITASKSIRFAEPLPTGGVALLACVSGWAGQVQLMMAGCLTTNGSNGGGSHG